MLRPIFVFMLCAMGLLVGAVLPHAAYAVVKETLAYHYYTVPLQKGGDWSAAVNNSAPMHGENNAPLCGFTQTDISWDFDRVMQADGMCHIANVRTTLTASITLPDLVTDEANKLAHFRHYRDVLHTHELGHLEIGRQAANNIDALVSATPPMTDCDTLTRAANQSGDTVLSGIDAQNAQHDNPQEYARVRNSASEKVN